jgi:glutamate/tyrosine decarboxylase-like PLP-dependent enzyme
MNHVLQQVATRLQDNYPYFHPLYAGQMLKPPHAVARLAYALAMWLNPNNHALDGGRASSAMEQEAVAALARMIGWNTHLGHLCSGGTMANLEALWVAGQLHPGKRIVASDQAHYTHARLSQVLGLRFQAVPCDSKGRLNVSALEQTLQAGDVGTVVATLGTTATGSIDPLAKILELRQRYGFRIHADAAYGGYFCLAAELGEETRANLEQLGNADSVVIDPHKHGLQPYGCGCVLFRDPSIGRFYRHDSPYTYFTSNQLHLGEISLECSRPGAAAVALWATQQFLPLTKGGAFAQRLDCSLRAAAEFHKRLEGDPRFLTGFPPELDIVVWLPRAANVNEASNRSRQLLTAAAENHLHLALAQLPVRFFQLNQPGWDRTGTVSCLRSVLMKPEHLDWTERIYGVLDRTVQALGW